MGSWGAMSLTEVEQQKANELFTLIDRNSDRTLSIDELFSLTAEESTQLMECDFDHDELISRNEWMAFMAIKKEKFLEEDETAAGFTAYLEAIKLGMRRCMQVRKMAADIEKATAELRSSIPATLPLITIPREELLYTHEVHQAARFLFDTEITLALVLADFCCKGDQVLNTLEGVPDEVHQCFDDLINDHFKPAVHAALIAKKDPAAAETEARFSACLPHETKTRPHLTPSALAHRTPALSKDIMQALHAELWERAEPEIYQGEGGLVAMEVIEPVVTERIELVKEEVRMKAPVEMKMVEVKMVAASVCRMLGSVNGREDFTHARHLQWRDDGTLQLE